RLPHPGRRARQRWDRGARARGGHARGAGQAGPRARHLDLARGRRHLRRAAGAARERLPGRHRARGALLDRLRAQVTAFLDDLRARLPELSLLTEEIDRESYRRDETAHFEPGLPLAVALPSTVDEIAAIMRLATEYVVPVVPRGAGTGLSGGSAGVQGALTIALVRMNRILEIDRANLVAVVEPGVINADLKAAVANEGLFYPPDPASYD